MVNAPPPSQNPALEGQKGQGLLFPTILDSELAGRVLATLPHAVILADANSRVLYLNPAAEKLSGWALADAKGKAIGTVFRIRTENRQPAGNPIAACFAEGRSLWPPRTGVLQRKDGTELAVEHSAAPVQSEVKGIVGAALTFRDVTHERSLTRQLWFQATHDALTGLVNRAEFESRLQRVVEQVAENGGENALCYLDLDQFKVVNDVAGHAAGDVLLRQIGTVIGRCLRQRDTIGRLGGDEFGVLLERCPLPQAVRIANTIRRTVSEFRFVWEGTPFALGASIGVVAVAPGMSPAEALQAADAASFAAKRDGRNRVHVYHPDQTELAKRQGTLEWVHRVTDALAKDKLELFCQPVMPLKPGLTLPPLMEVLLRLNDDPPHLLSPGAFIPPAERYGLMPDLDRWVVRKAAGWYKAHCAGHPERSQLRVSVNLSAASLRDPDFPDFLRRTLASESVPPENLCLEISETAATAHLSAATGLVTALRLLGCSFALDDFGSGMSSFAYLKHFPVDFIKIDGSLTRKVSTDPVDSAVVEAIARIGSALQILTIAEEVETEELAVKLRLLGIDYGQGFALASPIPLSQLKL